MLNKGDKVVSTKDCGAAKGWPNGVVYGVLNDPAVVWVEFPDGSIWAHDADKVESVN